ncbi:MAG: hypothetical protein RIQ72_623 [Candidatus Parcubacteria bacterium]
MTKEIENNNSESRDGATIDFKVAHQGKRFIHMFLDGIIIFGISYSLISIFHREYDLFEKVPLINSYNLVVGVLYFIIAEYVFSKTFGKSITRTKVVRYDGSKVNLKQVVGRSLLRYVPLDQLSFLRGKTPIGWHDMLSKTLVVDDSYTTDDILKIDRAKMNSKGAFSVIFWFFVVLIGIGLASSFIIASLETYKKMQIEKQIAQHKYDYERAHTDEEVISGMTIFHKQTAPQYYTTNNSFGSTTSCGQGVFEFKNMNTFYFQSSKYVCVAHRDGYRFMMILPEKNKPFCMDSKGFFGEGLSFSTGCESLTTEELKEYGY